MASLVLFCPFFGPRPVWAKWVLASMLANAHVDFVLIGDRAFHDLPLAPNIRTFHWSLIRFMRHISATFELDLSEWPNRTCTGDRCGHSASNKISDTRPFMGALFGDIASRYEWWGWMDFDVVLGRVTLPLSAQSGAIWSPICLRNPVGLRTWGPFTAFRTHATLRAGGRRAVSGLRPYEASHSWRHVLGSRKQHGFDELSFSGIRHEGVSNLLSAQSCVTHSWRLAEPKPCKTWRPCANSTLRIDASPQRPTVQGVHLANAKRWVRSEHGRHACIELDVIRHTANVCAA